MFGRIAIEFFHIDQMHRFLLILYALALSAQAPDTRVNPTVREIVSAVSAEHMAATLHKLESFGTRYVLSPQDDPVHGIGAAKRWIHGELQSYSRRLDVSYQDFTIRKGARQGQIIRDVNLSNIVAILPGTIHRDRYILITGHYDTVNLVRKPYTGEDQIVAEAVRRGVDAAEERRFLQLLPREDPRGPLDFEKTADAKDSPGVTDDGSGTAAVMELARVMSRYTFDKTLVFIAFSAEEVGLSGSQAYAAMARKAGMQIEAVLNNDIIGSDRSGNGQSATNVVRVFASPSEDSPARELGRYVKLTGERYEPSMRVNLIFRRDRFLRGGDHTPFVREGYAAVRLTSASEDYENQHTATDTFANTSVPYATRVARINAAAAAALALAPAPPVLNWTWQSGPNKGGHVPLLTRGKSGYDAVLHWLPNPEPDLAGYSVLVRATTSPFWERAVWVGNVTSYTMPDVSIDDIAIGVQAVDNDGNASLVSPYMEPVSPAMITPAAK